MHVNFSHDKRQNMLRKISEVTEMFQCSNQSERVENKAELSVNKYVQRFVFSFA